jgi:hypothetical protein
MVEIIRSYSSRIDIKRVRTQTSTLDNEASAALKSFFTENDVEYQLVPTHCHIHNDAERAIHTFKEHFVSGLASVDPDFPLHSWDRLLPQEEMTVFRHGTLPRHGILQKNCFFSARLQNHST